MKYLYKFSEKIDFFCTKKYEIGHKKKVEKVAARLIMTDTVPVSVGAE